MRQKEIKGEKTLQQFVLWSKEGYDNVQKKLIAKLDYHLDHHQDNREI